MVRLNTRYTIMVAQQQFFLGRLIGETNKSLAEETISFAETPFAAVPEVGFDATVNNTSVTDPAVLSSMRCCCDSDLGKDGATCRYVLPKKWSGRCPKVNLGRGVSQTHSAERLGPNFECAVGDAVISSAGCNGIEGAKQDSMGACRCAGQCKRILTTADLLEENIQEAKGKMFSDEEGGLNMIHSDKRILMLIRERHEENIPGLLKRKVHLKCKESLWFSSLQCEDSTLCYCEEK